MDRAHQPERGRAVLGGAARGGARRARARRRAHRVRGASPRRTRCSRAGSPPTWCRSGSSPRRCSRRSPTRDDVRGAPVLYVAAEGARHVLSEGLRALGCAVDVVSAYRTVPDGDGSGRRCARRSTRGDGGRRDLRLGVGGAGRIVEAVGAEAARRAPAVSIGPVTSDAVRGAGITAGRRGDGGDDRRAGGRPSSRRCGARRDRAAAEATALHGVTLEAMLEHLVATTRVGHAGSGDRHPLLHARPEHQVVAQVPAEDAVGAREGGGAVPELALIPPPFHGRGGHARRSTALPFAVTTAPDPSIIRSARAPRSSRCARRAWCRRRSRRRGSRASS